MLCEVLIFQMFFVNIFQEIFGSFIAQNVVACDVRRVTTIPSLFLSKKNGDSCVYL